MSLRDDVVKILKDNGLNQWVDDDCIVGVVRDFRDDELGEIADKIIEKIHDNKIYMIYDKGDGGYDKWYATENGIIDYLEERKEQIPDYNKTDGWIENLERYGLSVKNITIEE